MKTLKTTIILVLTILSTGFLYAQSTNNPPAVITNGLVGIWHLDGNALDSSGSGHNGTVVGATPTTGRFGQGYNFNGSSYIDLGNLDFSSGQYTVSGWIRTDRQAITEDWRMWISKMDGTGGLFELFIRDGRLFNGGNGPGYISWNGGTGLFDIFSTDSSLNLRDGVWHLMSATFKQGSQIVYIDGVEVAGANYAGPVPGNSPTVKIGGVNFGAYHHPWIGDVDEVSIYNRALTSSEVRKLALLSPLATLTISPNPGLFINTQTYDLTFILRNTGKNTTITSQQIILDGVDRTAEFLTGATQGKISNGLFIMTGSPELTAGKHTLSATFVLSNGQTVSDSVTYNILAVKP